MSCMYVMYDASYTFTRSTELYTPPYTYTSAKKNQYNNNKQSKLNFIIYTQLLSCQIPGIMYQNIYVFFSFPFPLSTKIEISKKKKNLSRNVEYI